MRGERGEGQGKRTSSATLEFIGLNDDQGSDQGDEAGGVEDGMGVGALAFLLGGVGWLEEQDGFDGEEEAGGVEELLGIMSIKHSRGLVKFSWGEKLEGQEGLC